MPHLDRIGAEPLRYLKLLLDDLLDEIHARQHQPCVGEALESEDLSLFWIDEEFGDEIILSLGEVKLVNQKIAAARPLALFTNQKRIEERGRGDGKQFAFPAVLLVNDQVKIIEVASGVDGLLSGFFREDSVKGGGEGELLYWK